MLIIQADVFFCTFPHDFNAAYIYIKYLFWVGEIGKKETQACKSNRFTKEFQAEWPLLLGRSGLKIYHDVISSKYMVKCAHIGQYHNFRTGDQF